MSMHRLLRAAGLVALAVLLACGVVLAQDGPAVDWWVIASGGQPSSGGVVSVNDTLGQPFTGQAQGGTTAMVEGLWHAGMGPAPPGPDLRWWTIANGGAPSTGGAVTMNDTLGQPFIGPALEGATALSAGYWHPRPGPTPALGDANGDGLLDSTDALIVLTADVGLDTAQYCPMNCSDTNADGFVDSTDALIILSYDAGMTVPFPVGQSGCPATITQPPGCNP